ncbi:hypothetical protein EG328_009133 [Venturia inaequalis]|uniref:F-box domain-containing protein n=1 Tax=Venturia inaequalis TaxID=5025 RepID=A0A8H3Z5P0_VENIN|nr:hypothetical protein EG328_009133 [Venturia inaequalis]
MPFPAFKAWLAGVFTKRGQLETSTPQPGPLRFLDLPTDVLLCILDQATLTDMILLSQTCQWLHKLLQLHRINFNKSFVLWVPLSNFREGNRSTNKRRSLSTTSCNYEMVQQFNILTTKRTWMDHSHRVYLADFLRAQYEPQGLGRLADKLAMRYKIVQDRFLVKRSTVVGNVQQNTIKESEMSYKNTNDDVALEDQKSRDDSHAGIVPRKSNGKSEHIMLAFPCGAILGQENIA